MTAYNRDTAGPAALAWAKSKLGDPYIYGGTGPVGFDCSGLVQEAYLEVGVALPRVTEQQYDYADTVLPVSAPWEPGDLAFILGSDSIQGEPGHVGIYVGTGTISGGIDEHGYISGPGQQIFLNAPYTGDPGGIRYDYFTGLVVAHTRPAQLLPNSPAPRPLPMPLGHPSAAQLEQCNLVGLPNPTEEQEAKSNGWTIRYFSCQLVKSGKFYPALAGLPVGTELYANARYETKRTI